MKTRVYVTAQFEGCHRWAHAPKEVEYLRNYHRHMFHVRLDVYVEHNNRAIEFITLKKLLERVLANYSAQPFELSCEQIAVEVINYFAEMMGMQVHSCEVSEDGENGAVVEVDYFELKIRQEEAKSKPLRREDFEAKLRGGD